MKDFLRDLVIVTSFLAVAFGVSVCFAQFHTPDQRARPGNVRANTVTATTIQAGVVPQTLPGLAGTGSLSGCAEGTGPTSGLAGWDLFWCDSTAHQFKVNMNNGGNQYIPFISSLPSLPGQTPTYATSGAFSAWQGMQGTLTMDGALGSFLTTARAIAIMSNAGHFTNLACVCLLTGTCTTIPHANVFNVTQVTSGTATAAFSTTVATVVSAAQTLTFAAGDQIAIGISTAGATCTAPIFSCNATYTQP